MGGTTAHPGPGALVGERFLLGARLPGPPGAAVHLARDVTAGAGPDPELELRLVAPTAGFLERAARARAASTAHPGAVALLAFGLHEGRGFLVTPRVAAPDALARVAAGGLLAPREAVRAVEALAGALDAAHDAGVLHLGVGPSEVLLPGPGGAGARLTGLGAHPGPAVRRLGLAATPWTAPELTAGAGRAVDRRADVFGLAAVLGHLALGRWPGEAPRAQPGLHGSVAAGLEALLERALSADPADRPASAGRLAAEARAVLERAARERRGRRRTGVRRGAVLAGAAAAGVLVAAGGTGAPVPARESAPARAPAPASAPAPAPREVAFVADLTPLLAEGEAARRAFRREVLARSVAGSTGPEGAARLAARASVLQRRRARLARRVARLPATTAPARRVRELAVTVLEGRLDHGRLLADELRDAAAGRGGRLAARHAASQVHLRQLDRFLTVTSRTALTDAVNALRRRAGEPPLRRVDL